MQMYQIELGHLDQDKVYRTTLKASQDFVKGHGGDPTLIRVELVNIVVDQATVCDMLNGQGCRVQVVKTWKMGPRGGLVACENGE